MNQEAAELLLNLRKVDHACPQRQTKHVLAMMSSVFDDFVKGKPLDCRFS